MPTPASRLPAEIWSCVFQLAAGEPSPVFDTLPLPPASYDERAWTHKPCFLDPEEDHTGYQDRLKTRRALVLVNRYWRHLATPVMFEYVAIRKTKALLSFGNALQADWKARQITSFGKREEQRPQLGHFVRYLYINIFDYRFTELPTAQLDAFVSAFRLCTNLVVLIVEGDHSPISTLVKSTLFNRVVTNGSALKCIRRWGDIASIAATIQHQFSSLEVLDVTVTVEPSPDISSLPSFSLPRLHTLRVASGRRSTIFQWVARWDLPALQACHLPITHCSADPSDFLSFFEAHGSKITTIDFGCLHNPFVETILPFCTAAREVTLPPQLFAVLIPIFTDLHGVRLTVCRFALSQRNVINNFMGWMEQCMAMLFENRGSCFKRLRLAEFDVGDFAISPWTDEELLMWKGWIERCRKERIQFEFENGDLVEVPWYNGDSW
jgi:hypothetical protein